ncbi:MAG: nucleotidyltransferase domain-containing protein [Candidatus Levybacteria bacterium]|nr:nucleotidyltransferase domain-containing protein [Candidatus Levybacteria bacterium]MBI3070321.1 nucleotidyltransferase domain-containing protein [Candidatus Levybacteria bacterium]MBI3092812.1 nucleotidyltransferase domain-containing protein [Candidatus Levybacteria bacterium]
MMEVVTPHRLDTEHKRFSIHPESMFFMNGLRAAFMKFNRQYPYISGLGFFGSRTRGQEHEKSDIDLIIFSDSSKFPKRTKPLEDPYFIIETFKGRLIQAGNGIRIHMAEDDISERTTERCIKELAASRPRRIFDRIVGIDPKTNLGVSLLELSLASRFFLAVGDDIYRSRKFILDKLKTMPDGDRCWKIIMDALAKIESGSRRKKGNHRQYQEYPQTIEEAERYFLIRSYQEFLPAESDEQQLARDSSLRERIGWLINGLLLNPR